MTEVKTSRQFQVSLKIACSLKTAVGYPRPAPLLAASDHVFFEDRTAGVANRSTSINLFPGLRIKLYLAFVIPGCALLAQARNPYSPSWLWIPGSLAQRQD
jgi:hypothetical protein